MSSYLLLQIFDFGFLLFQSELLTLNYLLHLLVLLLLTLQNSLNLKNERKERKTKNVRKKKFFIHEEIVHIQKEANSDFHLQVELDEISLSLGQGRLQNV